jgi:hypothetical protein
LNNKSFSGAFLTATLISSLILVSAVVFVPVQASTDSSSIPKPSVPEFTVTLVDSSYDVPTTYSTDEYTGETITHEGYRVERRTIELKIKNHPFSPFSIQEAPQAAEWNVNFYYNVRYKGHFSEDWHGLYLVSDGYPPQELESEYTVLSYKGGYSPTEGMSLETSGISTTLPAGAKVDFEVEAMIGYTHRDASTFWAPWVFEGETSGWSETQTITIPAAPSPTSSPPPTPIPVPGYSAFSVESNSTVTDLFFNSTSSELSFTVNGTTGTRGYVKVTVAKSLVSSIQNVKAYLDGSELVVTITSDENSWFLTFNYSHSTHNVKISLTGNEATAPLLGIEWVGISVAIIVVVVGFCLLFYFKKRNR